MNSFAASRPEMLAARRGTEPVLRIAQVTRLLRRHLWLIGFCTVTGGAGAFIYAHTLPKTYTANGLMSVDGDRLALPELQGVLRSDDGPDPMPFVHTEVQALTSRALDAQVVRQLHLETNPEFNADLRPPTLSQRLSHFFGHLLQPILPKSAPGPSLPPSYDGVIGAAQKALSVFQDNRSLVISISFVSKDPVLASRFVNTLITDYVASRAQHRLDANQGAGSVLAQRIVQARADLAAVQKQMQDLRDSSNMVGLPAGSVGQQQVQELTSAAAATALERSQLQISYDRATAAAQAGSSDALASVLNSPTISRLRDEEALAEGNVAQLSAHYGSGHPAMRAAMAQLRATRQQLNAEVSRIVASLGAQLRVAREQDDLVHRQLEAARHGAVAAENAQARMNQLQQEEVTRQSLYRTLLERSQQTVAEPAADSTPDVRVLSPAVPPAFPTGPHTTLVGLLGACGGALLGALGALARLRTVRGFESSDEIVEATGMPVLMTLSRRMLRRTHLGSSEGARGARQTAGMSHEAAEAMRVTRNRLRFAGWSSVPRCALFVPDASRSNSHLAVRLADSFARVAASDGERVLLVDADLGAPSLRRHLGLAAASPSVQAPMIVGGQALARAPEAAQGGLMTALTGADWRDAVIGSDQPGLDLLLVDQPVHNSHSLIGSVTFQNLLVEFAADYDLVVLSGPASGSADAETLVQRADAAIMVIDARGDRDTTLEAVNTFRTIARTPMFAVLVQRT